MARRGEFDLIAEVFAPLAAELPGALGLKDDAALILGQPGRQFVTTVDAMIAGVHFIGDEGGGLIAAKLLRANLSDLAAMGARPEGYLLTLALPPDIDDDWLNDFAAGLHADQRQFGIKLLGGDTVSTPGPLSLTLTAIGSTPENAALLRSGVQAGDDIHVTGTIGDAALGLKALRGEFLILSDTPDLSALIGRYQLPQPRLEVGHGLAGLARAAIDVSDGLVADLGHLARAGGVAINIEAERVPLSGAARQLLTLPPDLIETVLTGGDDYELVFSADPSRRAEVEGLAQQSGVAISRIGNAAAGTGVTLVDAAGEPLDIASPGWTHF